MQQQTEGTTAPGHPNARQTTVQPARQQRTGTDAARGEGVPRGGGGGGVLALSAISVQVLPSCLPQVLAYAVASVTVSAFSGGLIDAAKAEEAMNTLRTLTEESQQVSTGLE